MAISTAALPQIGRSWKAQIVNGTGTALLTIVTPSASFSFAKIVGLIATNDDASNAYNITWGITRGGVFFPIATIAVPANSGLTTAAPPVNLLDVTKVIGLPTDNDGQSYCFLEQVNADTLQAQSGTTVTAAKHVNIQAVGGEY